MCEPTTIIAVVGAIAAVAGAGITYRSQMMQAETAEEVGKANARMAEYAAQDSVSRGNERAAEIQRRGAQIRGAQRAAMAARGLDLTEGTPALVLDETTYLAEADARTERFNASREAWAIRSQGAIDLGNARATAGSTRVGAAGGLLAATGQAAASWYSMAGGPAGKTGGGSVVKGGPSTLPRGSGSKYKFN